MAGKLSINGHKPKKGKKMVRGKGWRLVRVEGRELYFVGTLLTVFNSAGKRLAIFSVP
jgi:hypothetical protein